MKLNRSKTLVFLLIISIPIAMYLSLQVGFDKNVLSTILSNQQDLDHIILFDIRLPRMLFIFMAGASICLSGYLFQLLVQNPLADAYILGTASGAGLGVNLAILGILPFSIFNIPLTSLWALVFSLLVTLIVISLAQRKKGLNMFLLIIGGVAISSFCTAISSLLIYFSDSNDKIRNIIFWSLGSFDHIQWKDLGLLAIALFIIFNVVISLSSSLHLLIFGHNKAKDLGTNPEKSKWIVLVSGSILTAFTVAICGPISFIGLIIPHFIRAMFGSIGRLNLIFVTLIGGVSLLLCDTLARTIYPPVGLPIGIVTSLIGIPLFIYLLVQSKYRF